MLFRSVRLMLRPLAADDREAGGSEGVPQTKGPMKNELTVVEETRLLELIDLVNSGMVAVLQVGEALTEIRDRKLYRKSHETFQEFAEDNFQISRAKAYRLIDAAEVAKDLSHVRDKSLNSIIAMKNIPKEQRKTVEKAASKIASAAGRKMSVIGTCGRWLW